MISGTYDQWKTDSGYTERTPEEENEGRDDHFYETKPSGMMLCIWPKCDEHCAPSSIQCSRHRCKRNRHP